MLPIDQNIAPLKFAYSVCGNFQGVRCLWPDCGWVESNTHPWTWICRGEIMVTDWTRIDCETGMCVTTEKSRTMRDRGKNVESFWLLHGRGYHVDFPGRCREIARLLRG